ncbi:response regulator transcription factor [Neolewinella lacunae]|uniref:Response regulator transcription factor n=1 Tax=Neolewinella lacunae TaxID=1517758 RepID=A0A923PLI6_9BACT|nr:response regulator transcription factor [Neolewinella lacunae]MBC6996255.1 response regulator transcription factor [Neolewinella lacunae]MDN3636878.1 response regulator transcription factor [Neolewinella lacunae]
MSEATQSVAPKVLLVEDDQNFGDVLRSFLEVHDYDVTLATDGLAGFEAYRKGKWDLCIFDVMMPRLSGFELAKKVRENDTQTPIVFLTAKAMKDDVLNGFEIGADDYITKPFNSEELLARMNVILRRTQAPADPKDEQAEFSFGEFHFNYPLRILTHTAGKGEKAKEKLSPKEAQLLRLFALNKNNVLSRSEALTKIWGEDNYFTARSMDVFITKLRKYLKPDEDIEIVNIHGNGFQLLVRNEQAEA